MKNLIILLTIIGLIGCKAEHSSTTENNYKTIILKTSGSVDIEPDEASISVSINCIDKDIMKAKDCLIEKSNNLNAELQKHGIEVTDILTTRVNLTKDYQWQNNSHIFNGYKASTSTHIKIRDLSTLEKLYPQLLSNEALTIGGLSFQHSQIDSLNEAAYLKALENANTLADKILLTLPEENKMITQISNIKISESKNTYRADGAFLEKSFKQKSKMPINTGNLVTQKQIYVEFKVY